MTTNQNETMREVSSPGKANKKFGVESWNPTALKKLVLWRDYKLKFYQIEK